MNLATITLKLRPRGAYEATDLGVRLLNANAGTVYLAWMACVLPLMLALLTTANIASWLPMLLIWWLKPLYDRIVLFVLSRAVFGSRLGLADLDWRRIFSSGLLWSLTLGRVDFTRSFSLPVRLLEGLTGRAGNERLRVLKKSTGGNAVMLTAAYLHIEFVIVISLFVLMFLFTPENSQWLNWDLIFGGEAPGWLQLMDDVFYIAAITYLEPYYVASGFTLYLSRRVELEAWDIELDLRKGLPAEAAA